MINVRQFLSGMKFPASKKDIVQFARDHKAPGELLNGLEGIQDRKYNDPSEVSRAVSLF